VMDRVTPTAMVAERMLTPFEAPKPDAERQPTTPQSSADSERQPATAADQAQS